MITTFTIDRAKWLNGSNPLNDSSLRDPKGNMCCLGFYAKACGIKAKAMTNLGYPFQLQVSVPEEMDWLTATYGTGFSGTATMAGYSLVSVNDETELTKREREKQIQAKFAEAGITVTFTGKYPVAKKKATAKKAK